MPATPRLGLEWARDSDIVHHRGTPARVRGSTRYIGSKLRIVDRLLELVGSPVGASSCFVDAFAGTGVVAGAAAARGWPVRLNDQLYCAVVMATARVLSPAAVPFDALGGYARAIERLDGAGPHGGVVWREYSPASALHAGVERRYFTEANAARIDGIRREIAAWSSAGLIGADEERLLLADLLAAANCVANTCGMYNSYFRRWWLPSARRALRLAPRALLPEPVPVETYNVDARDVPAGSDDCVYYDPPYTPQQYASAYHLLETIAVGDEPAVSGVTGKRPWTPSAYSRKAQAADAIVGLCRDVEARRVLLSYSSQGIVPLADLCERLAALGELRAHHVADIGRYRPNRAASAAGSRVSEYVLELRRADEGVGVGRTTWVDRGAAAGTRDGTGYHAVPLWSDGDAA